MFLRNLITALWRSLLAVVILGVTWNITYTPTHYGRGGHILANTETLAITAFGVVASVLYLLMGVILRWGEDTAEWKDIRTVTLCVIIVCAVYAVITNKWGLFL